MPSSSSAVATTGDLRGRLLWLTLFRTVATTLLLVALAFRFGSRSGAVELGNAEYASFIVIGTVYLLTLGTGLVLRRGAGTVALAWAQIAFDLALAVSVVLLSGGSDSPFIVVFLLAIVGASALLGRRGAGVAAVGSAIAYVAVALLDLAGPGRRPSVAQLALEIGTQLLAQGLIALLSGYVAEQLSKTGGRLSERERDLRELTALQNRIVGAIPSGLVTCDPGGRVTYVNPAARAILGLADRPSAELTVDELMPGVLQLRTGRRSELTVKTPRGERSLGLSMTPLEGPDGVLIVFQDLTELRRAERELDRLDRLASLGRLSAQLAHEVRNPLASMRGAAQLLVGDTSGTPQERMARLIVTEADRLSGLVDGYLRLARPPPPERVHSRVDRIAAETVEVMRADPSASAVALDEQLEPVEAWFDVDQLKQVLFNLLRNALAAAGRGGQVRVETRRLGDQAELRVWDSAGSIHADDIARLFEPFFSRQEGGTGLGLSTVQSIVHAHHGTIDVESAPGKGTTFTIRLPTSHGA